MILEKSLYKLIKINLKSNMYLAFLSFITFLLCFPVRLLFLNQTIGNTYTTSNTDMIYQQTKMIQQVLERAGILPNVILMVFAFIMAAFNFKYLHSSASEDFYHSIPIKRRSLFLIRYINGAILILAPYILANVLGMILGLVITTTHYNAIPIMLYAMLRRIVAFMAVYSCIVFSMVITGRTFIGCLTAVFFMSFLPGCLTLYYSIVSICYQHILNHDLSYLFLNTSAFSPASSIYYHFGDIISVLISIGYAIAFLILGIILYGIRPSESAGEAYSWEITKNIFKFMITIPSSFLTGYLIYYLAGADMVVTDRTWFAFSTLFSVCIYSLIIDMIFNQGSIKLKKGIKLTAAAFLTDVLILIITICDPFGMDTYIPKTSDLRSVGFSSVYETYYQGTIMFDPDASTKAEINQTTDVTPILKTVSKSMKNPVDHVETENISTDDGNISVDKTIPCTVCYVLKSGRKVYRIYAVDVKSHEKLLSTLTKSNDFNKHASLFQAEIQGPSTEAVITDWNTQVYINKSIPLLQPDIKLLQKALQKDSELMTYSDYKNSTALFDIALINSDNNYDYASNNTAYISEMYIYPEYKNTLEFLRKRGVSIKGGKNMLDEITNITYQPYVNGNISINISGKEKIKTFLSSVKRIPDMGNPRTDIKSIGYVNIYYKNKSKYANQGIFVRIADSDKVTKILEEDKNE